MKKFEYMTKEVYSGLLTIELNTLGQEGWEMCGMNHNSDQSNTIYIFKRELSEIDD